MGGRVSKYLAIFPMVSSFLSRPLRRRRRHRRCVDVTKKISKIRSAGERERSKGLLLDGSIQSCVICRRYLSSEREGARKIDNRVIINVAEGRYPLPGSFSNESSLLHLHAERKILRRYVLDR